MDPDLLIFIGTLCVLGACGLTVSVFSSSDRSFRPVIALLFLGFGCIVYAVQTSPLGYTMADLPDIFLRAVRGLFGA
ncbi:MAG: hypothetical protein AAFY77_00925 [Pseudomonadota bacterium]